MENSSYYQNQRNNDFNRKIQSIASSIQKISQNVLSLQRLMNSSSDDEEVRNHIQSISHYTGQLAQDTKEDLKSLTRLDKSERMMREKLTSDFATVLNSFKQVQRSVTQRERQKIASYRQSHEQDPNEAARLPKDFQAQEWINRDFMMNEELREREQAIRQLEADVVDVNQIFKELATMVHEQGDTVDSIEAHIEQSGMSVHDGVFELGRAASYQTHGQRKKICLGLTAVLIVLLFIVCLSSYFR